MDAFETINDTLVNLFNEILKLEEEAIITGEFSDITNNDMHIIEAIGLSGKSTMSAYLPGAVDPWRSSIFLRRAGVSGMICTASGSVAPVLVT